MRQIHQALRLFHEGEWESVITLALAAEEQLPETELPHVWSIVKEKKPAASRLFNETRNWLKHNDDDEKKDEHYISEFEAHVSLVRAVSKYHAAYGEETDEMGSFVEFSRARGFTLSSPD
jgi:hypothetical protein